MKKLTVRQITTSAVMAAIASILFAIPGIPIFPAVPFYKLDFSNLPVLLGSFALGPVCGTIIMVLKSLIGLLHSTSGGVGELADFLAGAAMVIPAGFIYMKNKTRKGALLGMLIGTLCAVAAGILANQFILFPAYGLTESALVGLGQKMFPSISSGWQFVLMITGLFNLIKFVIISVVGYVIYKPLSPILHGRVKGSKGNA